MGATGIKCLNKTVSGIVTDGLAMHIDPLDPLCYGGTGTLLTDLTGNGNNITLHGGAIVDSIHGKSIYTTGTTGSHYRYASGSPDTYPNDGKKKTYCFWIESGANSYVIYADMGGSGNRGLFINLDSTGTNILFGGSQNGSNSNISYIRSTTAPITPNQIGLIGVNYDPIALTVDFFYNGLPVSNDGNVVRSSYKNSIYPRMGGAYFDGTWNNQEGRVPKIMIYDNKLLTASEHIQNFNASKSRFGY